MWVPLLLLVYRVLVDVVSPELHRACATLPLHRASLRTREDPIATPLLCTILTSAGPPESSPMECVAPEKEKESPSIDTRAVEPQVASEVAATEAEEALGQEVVDKQICEAAEQGDALIGRKRTAMGGELKLVQARDEVLQEWEERLEKDVELLCQQESDMAKCKLKARAAEDFMAAERRGIARIRSVIEKMKLKLAASEKLLLRWTKEAEEQAEELANLDKEVTKKTKALVWEQGQLAKYLEGTRTAHVDDDVPRHLASPQRKRAAVSQYEDWGIHLSLQGGSMDMEHEAGPPVPMKTHIHDLTEDCLAKILSLVGDADLPIQRPPYRDVTVSHPLQCALVCKRWRSCARGAVRSLSITCRIAEKRFSEQAMHFTALRRLHLSASHRKASPLEQIAEATPLLESLKFSNFTSRPPKELSAALRSWTRLKELSLRGYTLGLLLDILTEVPSSLESLSVVSSKLGDELVWKALQPHMAGIKKLAMELKRNPPLFLHSFMAAFPTLILRLDKSVPSYVPQLVNITELQLHWFEEKELPDQLGSMIRLQSLTIEHATVLESLPDTLGGLTALEVLSITTCRNLTHLPESLGGLSSLKVLHLGEAWRLWSLPQSLAGLASVERLCLEGVHSLEALPEGLGKMPNLRDLKLSASCDPDLVSSGLSQVASLREIPESLGELGKLTRLEIQHFSLPNALPGSMGSLRSLQQLHLQGLKGVQKLPDSLGQLSALVSIHLWDCGIASLPETLGQLSSLTNFCMKQCHGVCALPESMSDLRSLRELHVEECAKVAVLPARFSELTGLRELLVLRCESFCDKMGVIPSMRSLRRLELSGCTRQYLLPHGLENLTELRLIACSSLLLQRARTANQYPESFLDMARASGVKLVPAYAGLKEETGEEDVP